MTGVIATIPRIQFSNALGIPLAGGKLTTYLAGTTTPEATYQDQELTTKNPTTITLDATGSCVLWLDPEKSYKFLLKSALGVTQPGWPVDDVSGAAAGADQIPFTQQGVGAIKRSSQDKIRERVSIKDFGAVCDGVADDAAAVRSAVNSGAKVVDFLGLPTKINSTVTVPTGVSLVNVNAFLGAAGMTLFAVNSRVSICGRITGTGTATGIERAIYVAADGVTDVDLDGLTVSACNYAIHAQPLSGDATPEANWPARWKGRVTLLDIPGQGVAGNGYGLVMSPAKDCNFTLVAKNINRHALYLSAGARYNKIRIDVDGVVTSAAAQIYALSTQNACIGNEITGTVRGLGASTQAHGAYIGVNSHRNEIDVDVFGGGATAFFVEGDAASSTFPEENIVRGRAEGVYRVAPYHQKDAARTKFYPTINGYTSDVNRGCVNIESSGSFVDVGYAAQVLDAAINALSNPSYGIRSSVTQCPILIGPGVVHNNGAAQKVRLSGAAKRIGCLRRETGQTKVSNIPAGGTSVVGVAFVGTYENPRVSGVISKQVPTAGTFSDWNFDGVTSINFVLTVKNAAAVVQDITVDWSVEGD